MRDESNQGRRLHKRLAAVGLLVVSTPALALAPVYFDLGGLILLIVGFFALVVMGIGWSIGRGRGVAWSVGLLLVGLVAISFWASRSVHERESGQAA